MVTGKASGKPLVLRISLTDRCDLRCFYCMPEGGVPKGSRDEILSFEEIVRVVAAARGVAGAVAVRLTGGEPLLRRNIEEIVAMLHAEGIEDLALTTNGQRLGPLAGRLRQAGLKRVNISLDSLRPERFRRLTRGGELGRTLAGIEAALACDLRPVKLNAVILRGINDDEICSLAEFAVSRGCVMRFIELMPIGESLGPHGRWYVSGSEIEARLRRRFALESEPHEPGASARTFSVRSFKSGLRGRAGLICSVSHPFCEGCRRLRLTSRGMLLSCLLRGGGLDLRSMMRRGAGRDQLQGSIRAALAAKAVGREGCNHAVMATIGG